MPIGIASTFARIIQFAKSSRILPPPREAARAASSLIGLVLSA
jgi:hypothetical protein